MTWIKNKWMLQYFGWLLYLFSLLLKWIICIINVILSDWRRWVADEIGRIIRRKGEPVCSDAWVEIKNISQKTVKDLNAILTELEEFQTCVLPVDQNKRKYSICTFFFTMHVIREMNIVLLSILKTLKITCFRLLVNSKHLLSLMIGEIRHFFQPKITYWTQWYPKKPPETPMILKWHK